MGAGARVVAPSTSCRGAGDKRRRRIPRRAKYMQNILTCTGSGCSPGAEATFL
jgi:hypothetical protein